MIEHKMIERVHKDMIILSREHCKKYTFPAAILLHELYVQNTCFYEEPISLNIRLILSIEDIRSRTFLGKVEQEKSLKILSDHKIIKYEFIEKYEFYKIQFISIMQGYPKI